MLLGEAGKDASEAFEDVGHSDEAREILDKYFVGNGPAVSPGLAFTLFASHCCCCYFATLCSPASSVVQLDWDRRDSI